MVEQLICNQQVGGSSPSTSSNHNKIGYLHYGGVPEWPKGTDCKSAAYSFGGSNPPSPTIQKKSEPDSDWIWVRILRLYAGYFLLTSNCLSPGGAVWFFPAFLFIRVLAFPVFTRYDVGNQITRRKTIMEYIKSSLSAGCFYGICTWNQMFEI